MSSATTLHESISGTDALDVDKLYSVDGRVAIGVCPYYAQRLADTQ